MRTQLRESRVTTLESGRQATLVARVLPIVATAEAIIAEAKAELRLVADGSMQVSSIWNIRHQTPQALRLELPAEVELLGCTVGGRPTQPVQREKGTLEILLPKPEAVPCPPAGKEPKENSPLPCDTGMTAVTLVYAARTAALDPVSGKVNLSLPRTQFFIERLTWSVALPDTFEITAIEGNVRLSAGAQRDANRGEQVVALRKDLCRAESPRVEMF
jgi:hypothetical protein